MSKSAAGIQKFYEGCAIPVGSFARDVGFAMEQPDDVDINEVLFRPTRQEL
jgi:NADP-dependent 3-hydroxy acid dehydrogenase YdfG